MDHYDKQVMYILQRAKIDPEDLEQEVRLYELTHHRKASRRLIALRMQSQCPEILFSGEITHLASPLSHSQTPDYVTQALIEWGLKQELILQDAIFDFLENPEDEYATTLALLQQHGVSPTPLHQILTPESSGSFISALRGYLKRHSDQCFTKDQLIEWTRTIHRAKRPEASLRTALRRLIENKEVIVHNNLSIQGVQ